MHKFVKGTFKAIAKKDRVHSGLRTALAIRYWYDHRNKKQ